MKKIFQLITIFTLVVSSIFVFGVTTKPAKAALNDASFISHWKLDEASGTRSDSVGINNLTSNNGVGQVTGKIGSAASFIGGTQSLSVPDNPSLSMGPGASLTLTGWVKFNDVDSVQAIVSKRSTNINGSILSSEYILYIYNKQVIFKVSGNKGETVFKRIVFTTNVSANQWYFFAASYDGMQVSLSLNNNTPVTELYSSDIYDGADNFTLGVQGTSTYPLSGQIDSVSLWKRALTAGEITSLYNSGSGLDYPFSGGVSAPTLTTQAATGVGQTSVTGNGNITSTGEQNPTTRGFNYGPTVSYGSSTVENGSFGTGSFSGSISGLTCNTTYHYRAFATNSAGTAYGNDQSFTTATCAQTITITSPKSYQVIQRDGSNKADIQISGTYTGTPTAIEASWNGGSYTTIVASPSGNSFSGTLANQIAGQGELRVRFVNDTSVLASRAYVGVGDIFVIAGQSNSSGRGTNNQVYIHTTLKAGLFGNDDQWKELSDPTDNAVGQIDAVSNDASSAAGSVWPLVTTKFLANQNVPVAFIPAALGGTSIAQWQPGMNHLDATTLYGSMSRRINAAGGKAKAVVFWQGENDAYHGTSQADYKSKLTNMVNNIYTDFGIKTVVASIGKVDTATESNLDKIRLAQQSAWNDGGNVLVGPAFFDVNLPDYVHFMSNSELQLAADRWWNALNKHFYGGNDTRGPRFVSAIANASKTNIRVKFTDETLPITPAIGNLTGFKVKDNGSPATIISASRISDDTVQVNLNTPASGILTISYALGNDGYQINNIRDSSSLTLPAEPFSDEAVIVDSTAPTISSLTSTSASTSSTFTWSTDEQASSQVEYGLTNSYGTLTTEADVSLRVLNHSVTLSNLIPCVTYHYRVISRDASANTATGTNKVFTTSCVGNSNIQATSSTAITTNVGGNTNLTDNSRVINVNVPDNSTATTSTFTLQIKSLPTNNALSLIGYPAGLSQANLSSIVLDIKALINSSSTLDTFNKPLTITYQYTDQEIAGLVESSLVLYHYHDNVWSKLNTCTLDTSIKTITCTTTGLSLFALSGDAKQIPVNQNTNTTNQNGAIPLAFLEKLNQYNASQNNQNCTITINGIIKPCNNTNNLNNTNNNPNPNSEVQNVKSLFTKDLKKGSVDKEVKELQKFLNKAGFVITSKGAGSPGSETNTFGELTKQALIKYQIVNKIKPASGYFGPITRKSLNNN